VGRVLGALMLAGLTLEFVLRAGFGIVQMLLALHYFHFATPAVLQCNKNHRTIANSRAFLHTPVVSSTL
jgi:hypothetical protein